MHPCKHCTRILAAVFFGAACFSSQGASVQINPSSRAVAVGDNAIFTAVPELPGSYDYQWFFNNARLVGQTRSELRLNNVSTEDQGRYSVLVTDDRGGTASAQASLTVFVRPVLFQNGGRRVVTEGDWTKLETSAEGATGFQWYFNGQALSGKTNAVLVFERVTAAQAGAYTVLVSNSDAGIMSQPYLLDIAPPDGLEKWFWQHPSLQGNDLSALAYGAGVYVAVGTAGTLMTSTNGLDWVNGHEQSYGDLTDIAWGDAGFIAVGRPGRIVTSVDGRNWTVRPQSFERIDRIAFGNGVYVAIVSSPSWLQPPQKPLALISTNGMDWSETSLPDGTTDVAFGNGWFLASGNGLYRAQVPGQWSEVRGIIGGRLSFQNGALVLFSAGEQRDTTVLVGSAISTNGLNWVQTNVFLPFPTIPTAPEFGTKPLYTEMLYRTKPSSDSTTPLVSTNGLSWFRLPISFSNNVAHLEFVNGRAWGLGDDGYFVTSESGTNWQTLSAWDDVNIRSVAEGTDRRVAIAEDSRFLISKDNRTWQPRKSTSPKKLTSISYGLGNYVVIAQDTNLFVSTDGEKWSQVYTNGSTLRGVAFGNGRFVAAGDNPFLVSTNGTKWEAVIGPVEGGEVGGPIFSRIESIQFNEGKFIIAGGTIGESADGYNWSVVRYVPGFRVAYGNGRYVSVTAQGEIFVASAPNGVWIRATGDPFETNSAEVRNQVRDLIFGGGMFVLVATDGFIYASRDGHIWSRHYSGCKNALNAVVYTHSGTFLAVGNNGAILESAPPEESLAATLSGRTFRIDLAGFPGSTYLLQSTTTLEKPEWREFAVPTLLSSVTNIVAPHDEQHRFYRVVRR